MSIATLSALEHDFTVEQARTLTRVLEEDHHNLATKDDIKSTKKDIRFLEAKLTGDIKSLEAKLTGDIKSLEAKLTRDIKSLEAKLTGDIKSLEAKMATKEETQSIREDIKDIRGDIKSLEAKMDGNIKAIEAKMVTKTELNKTTNYLTRWIVTGLFLNMGVLYLLIKLFG